MKNKSSRVRKWLVSLALALATFVGFTLLTNWKFSLFLMGSVLFHELGHAWAMRRYGMSVKNFYFLPFVGAVIQTGAFPSYRAEAVVALMGPCWGFLQSAAMLAIAAVLDNTLLASLAAFVAVFNLFNLLPALPLDGGRAALAIAHSVSPRLSLFAIGGGLIVAGSVMAYLAPFAAVFVLWLGLREFVGEFHEVRRVRDRERIVAALAELLQVEPTAETVRHKIAAVRRRMRDPQAPPPEALIRVAARGDAALEARIRDLPYWHFAVQEMLSTIFEERVLECAHAARQEYRTLFRRRPYFATPALGSKISSLDELQRIIEQNTPRMNRKEILASFGGYIMLAAALYGVLRLCVELADRELLFAFMYAN